MLSPRYGDIAFVHLGGSPLLLVSNYQLAQEVLVKNAESTSGRRPLPAFNQVIKYERGKL